MVPRECHAADHNNAGWPAVMPGGQEVNGAIFRAGTQREDPTVELEIEAKSQSAFYETEIRKED